ncbi:MAG: DUF4199 domain-containing protein [Leadbetterella sp.]|nr:DUF4199 domain-containing protein [Leadbetterella sp.]
MEKVSTARIALKWGLIYGLLSIVVTTIIYTFNLMEQSWISTVASILLSFGVLYLAFREFRELNGGFMRFGQGLGLGMLLFVTAGVLGAGFDTLYKKVIDPGVVDKILDITEMQYEKSGMSPEAIEQGLETARPLIAGPLAPLVVILSYVVSGFICSLIMAAVMKKNQPVFE